MLLLLEGKLFPCTIHRAQGEGQHTLKERNNQRQTHSGQEGNWGNGLIILASLKSHFKGSDSALLWFTGSCSNCSSSFHLLPLSPLLPLPDSLAFPFPGHGEHASAPGPWHFLFPFPETLLLRSYISLKCTQTSPAQSGLSRPSYTLAAKYSEHVAVHSRDLPKLPAGDGIKDRKRCARSGAITAG